MSVTVTKNFDLGKINLDVHKELNLCGEIIKKDHYQRLEKGQGVDGSQMQSLASATIEQKAESRDSVISSNASKILVGTGAMRKLRVKKATKSNQEIVLWVGQNKRYGTISTKGYPGSKVTPAEAGLNHQKGRGVPKREWFGISEKAEKKCVDLIEMRIEKELNRA